MLNIWERPGWWTLVRTVVFRHHQLSHFLEKLNAGIGAFGPMFIVIVSKQVFLIRN
jgi:hypothetical protein